MRATKHRMERVTTKRSNTLTVRPFVEEEPSHREFRVSYNHDKAHAGCLDQKCTKIS
jgi:hypothetical protein